MNLENENEVRNVVPEENLDTKTYNEKMSEMNEQMANQSLYSTTQVHNGQSTQNSNTNSNVVRDTKLYQILSYIGVLWVISLLIPEKDDEDVKFHAGQGMVLFVFCILLNIAANIIKSIIVYPIFGYTFLGLKTLTGFGLMLSGVLSLGVWVITIYLAIKGIMNVNAGKKEELPYIGKYVFYK